MLMGILIDKIETFGTLEKKVLIIRYVIIR